MSLRRLLREVLVAVQAVSSEQKRELREAMLANTLKEPVRNPVGTRFWVN